MGVATCKLHGGIAAGGMELLGPRCFLDREDVPYMSIWSHKSFSLWHPEAVQLVGQLSEKRSRQPRHVDDPTTVPVAMRGSVLPGKVCTSTHVCISRTGAQQGLGTWT
jgi:hypothetical protein